MLHYSQNTSNLRQFQKAVRQWGRLYAFGVIIYCTSVLRRMAGCCCRLAVHGLVGSYRGLRPNAAHGRQIQGAETGQETEGKVIIQFSSGICMVVL